MNISKLRPIAWILTAAAICAAAVYLRLYPLTIFPELDAKNNAQLLTYVNIMREIKKNIDHTQPDLDPAKRETLASQRLKTALLRDRKQVQSVIDTTAQQIMTKGRDRATGDYLLGADPYYYLGLTQRILSTGKMTEKTRGRLFYNPKMLAPEGHWYPLDLHAYSGVIAYRVLSAFFTGISPSAAVRWVPVVLAIFCLPFFLLLCAKSLRLALLPSAIGAFALLCMPIFVKRSLAGWYDTDPYNVLFPVLVFWSMFNAMRPGQRYAHRLFWVLGSALFFGAHSFFWRGWMIPFFLTALLFSVFVIIPERRLPAKLTALKLYPAAGIFWLVPLLLTVLFWGFEGLDGEFALNAEFVSRFVRPDFSAWPDVMLTVGELKRPGFLKASGMLGGLAIPILAIWGYVSRLIREWREKEGGLFYPLLVPFGIFLSSFAVAVSIERFALLAVAPIAIGVALGIESFIRLAQGVVRWLLIPSAAQRLRAAGHVAGLGLGIACLWLLLIETHDKVYAFHPIFNKTWDKTMTRIKEETPSDSIVTSWWPPGHFITAMADRRVNLDGATQNEPQSYWVSRLFIEPSETRALGILRMLNTSGNRALDFLQKRGHELYQGVQLLDGLFSHPKRDEAAIYLKGKLPPEDVNTLLDLTHGQSAPPPTYLFIYDNMIEQAMALEFVGLWNFRKAQAFRDMIKKHPEKIRKELLRRGSPENVKLLWSLAERPSVQPKEFFMIKKEGDLVLFKDGLEVNLKTSQARIDNKEIGTGQIRSLLRIRDGVLLEYPTAGTTKPLSAMLIEDPQADGSDPHYRVILTEPRLARSLALRLFHLKGAGYRHIRPAVLEESVATRTRLYAFEVDWESFLSQT